MSAQNLRLEPGDDGEPEAVPQRLALVPTSAVGGGAAVESTLDVVRSMNEFYINLNELFCTVVEPKSKHLLVCFNIVVPVNAVRELLGDAQQQ